MRWRRWFVGGCDRGCAQSQQGNQDNRTTLKPDAPGLAHNHRLILKDGSYQVVRQYQVVGDRVRYLSLERGGDWEELPYDLVDWDATRKWEQTHTGPYESPEGASPAMKEAEEIDKEEAAARDEMKARMPEVAKGLELPDRDGVFALDTYQGTPELVELKPSDLSLNQKNKKGLATLNPLAGEKATVELAGANAKGAPACQRPGDLSLARRARQCGAGRVARHDRPNQRGERNAESEAWRAFAQFWVCDCESGSAPGGADYRRESM